MVGLLQAARQIRCGSQPTFRSSQTCRRDPIGPSFRASSLLTLEHLGGEEARRDSEEVQ